MVQYTSTFTRWSWCSAQAAAKNEGTPVHVGSEHRRLSPELHGAPMGLQHGAVATNLGARQLSRGRRALVVRAEYSRRDSALCACCVFPGRQDVPVRVCPRRTTFSLRRQENLP